MEDYPLSLPLIIVMLASISLFTVAASACVVILILFLKNKKAGSKEEGHAG
jgi:hypothetical protein